MEQIELISLEQLDREWASPKKRRTRKVIPNAYYRCASWFTRWAYDEPFDRGNPIHARAIARCKPYIDTYGEEVLRQALLLWEDDFGKRPQSIDCAGWERRSSGKLYIHVAAEVPAAPTIENKPALRDWLERYGDLAVRQGKLSQERVGQLRQLCT